LVGTGYPDRPGYRVPGPSQGAARRIAGKAKAVHAEIMAILRNAPNGLTSDQIAAELGMPNPYMARPRVAELHRQGLVVDSGQRRPGESGLNQTVWKIREDRR